jgi:hypothetical protein
MQKMMTYTHQLKSRRVSSAGEVKPATPAMMRVDSIVERLLIHDFNSERFGTIKRQASGQACAYAIESVKSVGGLFSDEM